MVEDHIVRRCRVGAPLVPPTSSVPVSWCSARCRTPILATWSYGLERTGILHLASGPVTTSIRRVDRNPVWRHSAACPVLDHYRGPWRQDAPVHHILKGCPKRPRTLVCLVATASTNPAGDQSVPSHRPCGIDRRKGEQGYCPAGSVPDRRPYAQETSNIPASEDLLYQIQFARRSRDRRGKDRSALPIGSGKAEGGHFLGIADEHEAGGDNGVVPGLALEGGHLGELGELCR